MRSITEKLLNNELFKKIIEDIKENISPIFLLGLTDVSKAYITGTLIKFIKCPFCIITYNEIEAKELKKNISLINKNVEYFPKKEITTYEIEAQSKDLLKNRYIKKNI